jgi:hypothetical protein
MVEKKLIFFGAFMIWSLFICLPYQAKLTTFEGEERSKDRQQQ